MKRLVWFLCGLMLAAGVVAYATTWSAEFKDPNYPQALPSLISGGTVTSLATSESTLVTLPASFHTTDYAFVYSIQTEAVTLDSIYLVSKAAGTVYLYTDSAAATIDWIAFGDAAQWENAGSLK